MSIKSLMSLFPNNIITSSCSKRLIICFSKKYSKFFRCLKLSLVYKLRRDRPSTQIIIKLSRWLELINDVDNLKNGSLFQYWYKEPKSTPSTMSMELNFNVFQRPNQEFHLPSPTIDLVVPQMVEPSDHLYYKLKKLPTSRDDMSITATLSLF